MRTTSLFTLGLVSAILSSGAATAADLRLRFATFDDGRAEPRFAADDDEEEEEEEEKSSKKKGKRSAKKSSSNNSGGGVNIGTQSSQGGVSPQGLKIGVGLQIGSPTALTGKYMLTGNQGVVGGIGAGLGGLSLHVDYLWHPQILATAEPFALSWYIGAGGWLGFFPYPNGIPGVGYFGPNFAYGYYNGHVAFLYLPYNFLWFAPSFAIRVPLGLSVALRQLPIEFYAGLTPSILIFPGVGFGLGGEIGGRIYF